MCIVLFCDNQGAVEMINSASSTCKQCMKLTRFITQYGLIHNVKITARHVSRISNELVDFLSRDKVSNFKTLAAERKITIDDRCTELPAQIWPVEAIWNEEL